MDFNPDEPEIDERPQHPEFWETGILAGTEPGELVGRLTSPGLRIVSSAECLGRYRPITQDDDWRL